jgi:peptidoglycan/xylan/chitin deacetylase (PgdA/CDA1 family)
MSDVLVLAYHAVSESWSDGIAVHPRALEQQMKVLLDLGYEPCTFTRSVLDPPAEKTVAVTFDDGFRSVFVHALPVLARLGVPATVFAPTAYVGGSEPMSWPGVDHWANDGAISHELLPASWGELQSLAEAGWEIGSHTETHPSLPALDDEQVHKELAGSRQAIETFLGKPCTSIAYPYGDVDDRVIEATTASGYTAACTIPTRFTGPTPLAWPRVCIYRSDGDLRFRAKVSTATRRLRRSRLWEVFEGLRQLSVPDRRG